eukprot:9154134-Alexandrium_andersonii.AAC.1
MSMFGLACAQYAWTAFARLWYDGSLASQGGLGWLGPFAVAACVVGLLWLHVHPAQSSCSGRPTIVVWVAV